MTAFVECSTLLVCEQLELKISTEENVETKFSKKIVNHQ